MPRPKHSKSLCSDKTNEQTSQSPFISNEGALQEMVAHSASIYSPIISVVETASSSISATSVLSSIMSTSTTFAQTTTHPHIQTTVIPPDSVSIQPLHRIALVRQEQKKSLNMVAKQLEIDVAEARWQENVGTDLLLSQLYRWRDILEVPVGELVVETEEMPNNPIRNRSQLVKIMKTVKAIVENVREERIKILSQVLFEQMVELMPELKFVSAWPSVGQSREQRDFGQAMYRRFDSFISRQLENE